MFLQSIQVSGFIVKYRIQNFRRENWERLKTNKHWFDFGLWKKTTVLIIHYDVPTMLVFSKKKKKYSLYI